VTLVEKGLGIKIKCFKGTVGSTFGKDAKGRNSNGRRKQKPKKIRPNDSNGRKPQIRPKILKKNLKV
jgi:hypothetical protein